MAKTGKPLPKNMTIGECYSPAMRITHQASADDYLRRLVERDVKYFGRTAEEALAVERQNLGYFAGYYDEETRRRVEKLFMCSHPIFGSIETLGSPTPEQALEMGKTLGRRLRQEDAS